MEVKRINEFVEGDNIFESRGISRVKVTKLIKEVIEGKETEKQVIECLEIPIQSTGVSELMEAGRAKAPGGGRTLGEAQRQPRNGSELPQQARRRDACA